MTGRISESPSRRTILIRSLVQLWDQNFIRLPFYNFFFFELQYGLTFCLDPEKTEEKTEENRRKTSFITKNKLKTLKSISLSWAISSFSCNLNKRIILDSPFPSVSWQRNRNCFIMEKLLFWEMLMCRLGKPEVRNGNQWLML